MGVEPDARPLRSLVADFLTLTKPRLSGLVLFTAIGGMWLANRSLELRTWLFAIVGTAGTIAAANTLNCVFERESDRFMARTARRPLPTGRVSPMAAVLFASVLTGFSLPMLWLVNPLTCGLGVLALVSYVFVYTPMKPRTHWAMQVGALPGALPPLMGWTAATNRIDASGLALFAILFAWQLPHFIAIALFRKHEYEAAGLLSLPLEKGDGTARLHAVVYSVLQLVAAVLPYFTGLAGLAYLAIALVSSVAYLTFAIIGWRRKLGAVWARQLFLASLAYLTTVFVALGTRL
ncbi:MAG: heme o synthase [Archangium sp.]